MIIHHDSYPNNVNDNDEHPNYSNNIDNQKNSDVSNNYTLCNDVNSSNTNSNNFSNNSSDNNDINNINTENNIDNVELYYNFKCRQSAHLIQKYGESFPYDIQFVQQSNTNICQRKFKHIYIRTKQHNAKVQYYLSHQCNHHLTLNKNYTTHDLCLSSFLLCMLEKQLHVHYGGDYIWRFIPTDYHFWWMHRLI